MGGRLYLVPNLLGVIAPERVLPAHAIEVARGLRHYIVENAKPARQFLKSIGAEPLQQIVVIEIRERDSLSPERCAQLLAPTRTGTDIGLLSDAGCPGVADPGALVVAMAHRERIAVTPLVGPSAVLLALMASGMNGQAFAFHGYLPVKAEARIAAIRRIDAETRRTGYAQLFIETPYRNAALLQALAESCNPATRLCVAADLTLATESVVSQPIADWRDVDFAGYAKRPAMFVLQG